MEITNFKKYMFELMVRKFMNSGLEDSYLLNEAFKSTNDPGFNEKVNEYISFSPLKKEYVELSDKEKVDAINLIEKILEVGETNLYYSSALNPVNQMAANAVAAYFKKANSSQQRKIRDFIFIYYNPYPFGTEVKSDFYPNASFAKVLPNSVDIQQWKKIGRIDEFVDIVTNSFFDSIEYLLNRGKFDGEKNLFDLILFQLTWKGRILNGIKRWKRAHGLETEDDIEGDVYGGSRIKTKPVTGTEIGDKEEHEELMSKYDFVSTDSPFGSLEEPEMETGEYEQQPEPGEEIKPIIASDEEEKARAEYELKKIERQKTEEAANDEKMRYLISKISKKYRELLSLWYDFYKSKYGTNNSQANQTVIDSITSPDAEALDKFAPEGDSEEEKKFYDFIGEKLGITYMAARNRMGRLKEKLMNLIKDPEFVKIMGIEKFAKGKITQSGLLKGVISKDKKKVSEAQLDRIVMFSNISLNESLSYHKNKLNVIYESKVKIKQLSEGYEVDTISLDEQIYKYLNIVTEDLSESLSLLNELYRMHSEIELEYGEISEKLKNLIPPVELKIREVVEEVRKVKKSLGPYLSGLYETDLKKKSLSSDELEEERLTNPETKKFVRQRQNFIGSHIYGEDLGGLGKMYVAYSYGEQFPAYLWFKNKWYHNTDNYVLDDGSVNEPTIQHKADMRPVQDTHGLSTLAMNTMIKKFKNKYGIGDNVHKDVEPGEKN